MKALIICLAAFLFSLSPGVFAQPAEKSALPAGPKTKEQSIAQLANKPVAERQKPEFFAVKLVVKDSAERVAGEKDPQKIKLAENEEIVVLEQIADGKPSKELLIVERNARLNRTHVSDSAAYPEPHGWVVAVKFTEEGAKLLKEVTKQAVGGRMVLIFGGSLVWCAPTVHQQIYDGNISITGRFTQSEANAVASLFESRD